jgi:NADPH:quinone reductase-like Zn-dependent oxidoreductase
MPHAIRIRQTGGAEVLNRTQVEVNEAGSGQVRLREAAAGLNYIDVYRQARYQASEARAAVLTVESTVRGGFP